ncbi:hypothetical protein [Cupriavidus sp. IK-TO18]|uniref:hypothetical protein n=1 Tax=Cupriavidus sp. IK-TO18 TaxID=2782182 RepID=UPI001899AA05|nr:hypothetical protein [Cupriavidus sp. IK-TO18]MBF6986489.1 hypothetical protein [Cupriavidus sp. IK-TO18]
MSEPAFLDAFARKELHTRRRLVKEGQLVPLATARARLGVTRQFLNQLLSKRCMFTVDVNNERYIPAFYLSTELDRRKLEEATELLGDLPGWSKFQFFTTRKASLNGLTPLEALQHGMVEEVMSAAEAFAGP